jgi:hypothetical protein
MSGTPGTPGTSYAFSNGYSGNCNGRDEWITIGTHAILRRQV